MPRTRTSTQAILVHHTAGNETDMVMLRSIFKARFNANYVGYNLVIWPDGSVKTDIGDDGWGIHNATGTYQNHNSCGVSLVGNFSHALPPDAQLNALERELERLRLKYKLERDQVFGHRDFKSTACPGAKLYEWLDNYKEGDNVEALANTLRRVWFWLNGQKEPDMKSIRKEAEQIFIGSLDPYDLIKGWLDTSVKKGFWINGSDHKKLQKTLRAAESTIAELDLEVDKLRGNINVMTDRAVKVERELKACKADATKSLSISDHIKAIWSLLRGEK